MYSSSSSSSSSTTSYGSPCAACKFLRRKCIVGCVFAPHFPPEEHTKFVNVHKIFGAGNVTKLLRSLPVEVREDAVNSLSYEAEARVRDPVYGCVAHITTLQSQLEGLQKELDAANQSLITYAAASAATAATHPPPPNTTNNLSHDAPASPAPLPILMQQQHHHHHPHNYY